MRVLRIGLPSALAPPDRAREVIPLAVRDAVDASARRALPRCRGSAGLLPRRLDGPALTRCARSSEERRHGDPDYLGQASRRLVGRIRAYLSRERHPVSYTHLTLP